MDNFENELKFNELKSKRLVYLKPFETLSEFLEYLEYECIEQKNETIELCKKLIEILGDKTTDIEKEMEEKKNE
jgi:uncharacterized protein with HEPN domain